MGPLQYIHNSLLLIILNYVPTYISLNCVQKTCTLLVLHLQESFLLTGKVTMYSLISFAAGPAWEASGIARSPMQDVNVNIRMSRLVYT